MLGGKHYLNIMRLVKNQIVPPLPAKRIRILKDQLVRRYTYVKRVGFRPAGAQRFPGFGRAIVG